MFSFGTAQALDTTTTNDRGATTTTTGRIDAPLLHCNPTANQGLLSNLYSFIFGTRARDAEAQLAHLRGTVRVLSVEANHYKQLADLQNQRVVELEGRLESIKDQLEDSDELHNKLSAIQNHLVLLSSAGELTHIRQFAIQDGITKLVEDLNEQARSFALEGKQRLILIEQEFGTVRKALKDLEESGPKFLRPGTAQPKRKPATQELFGSSDSDSDYSEDEKKPAATPRKKLKQERKDLCPSFPITPPDFNGIANRYDLSNVNELPPVKYGDYHPFDSFASETEDTSDDEEHTGVHQV